MKNLFSKVHFGALAFIFALGLIITQSAFTTKTLTPNYYQTADGEWHSLGSKVKGTAPGNYNCDTNVETICTAYFPSAPEPDQEPAPGAQREEGRIILY